MRKLSENGFQLILKYECGGNLNKYLTAYLDPVGIWTIGIGSTFYENGTKVKKGDKITAQRAKELFSYNIREFEKAVNDSVKVPINQNQFDALVSFSYNVGIGAFKSSTLLKYINQNKGRTAIEEQFLRWKYGTVNGVKTVLNGLLKRRISESQLYFGDSLPITKKISTLTAIIVVVIFYFIITK